MPSLTSFWPDWLKACNTLGLSFSEEQLSQWQSLYDQLLAYNQQVNLTRLTEPTDFLYGHLLDSFTVLSHIPTGAYIADVGSGGGFPAIPMAMARPDLRVVAIESIGKKCQFIQQIQAHFQLGDRLKVLNARSEDVGQNKQYREQFDVVTARAVAALPVLLELTLPLLKVKGQLLALKGPAYLEELETAQKALNVLKAQAQPVYSQQAQQNRDLVILPILKVDKTPIAYPRKAGTAKKVPL